jgi:hypothetical protein
MQVPAHEMKEITDLLWTLGDEATRRCGISPHRIRYVADVHRVAADNDVGYTVQGGTFGLGTSDLHESPSDAIQVCADGTFWLGLAVVREHPKNHPFIDCKGIVFRVGRGDDGRICILEGSVGAFSQGDERHFSDVKSGLSEMHDFVWHLHRVRQADPATAV